MAHTRASAIAEPIGEARDLAEALQLMALGLEARGIEEGAAFSIVAAKLADQIRVVSDCSRTGAESRNN